GAIETQRGWGYFSRKLNWVVGRSVEMGSQFAIEFAGYKDKPFYLKINELMPPINLQRKIFPFIETLYEQGSPDDEK
ncbi:hypothetical protein BGZ76_003326, partial [Entomortierella beljakovae]